jgi:hypothetical protein
MSNIKIKVDFYDTEQKQLIKKNFPKDFEIIKDFDGKIIEFPIEDFKTYSFFKDQFTINGKHDTFIDLKKMNKYWGYYEKYFEVKPDGRIVNISPEDTIDKTDVSEMLGVAGGLSVASKMYGMTQADWTKIPITTAHKDFDFSHTSCLPQRYINIESKGSVIDNNSYKRPTISQHKASIIEKKCDKDFKKKYPVKKDTCIGIITVADRANNLQSWLVDPLIDDFEAPSEKVKILKRLYFYYSIFRILSKRSYLTLTLANRIRAIELVNDYTKLDKIPLINYNFEKISLSEHFINSRSRNKEKSVIGNTILIDNYIYFVGVTIDAIKSIITQSFGEISIMKTIAITNSTTLSCKLSKRRSQEINKFNSSKIRLKKEQRFNDLDNDNYFYFDMDADLIQNSSGLCIARQKL